MLLAPSLPRDSVQARNCSPEFYERDDRKFDSRAPCG